MQPPFAPFLPPTSFNIPFPTHVFEAALSRLATNHLKKIRVCPHFSQRFHHHGFRYSFILKSPLTSFVSTIRRHQNHHSSFNFQPRQPPYSLVRYRQTLSRSRRRGTYSRLYLTSASGNLTCPHPRQTFRFEPYYTQNHITHFNLIAMNILTATSEFIRRDFGLGGNGAHVVIPSIAGPLLAAGLVFNRLYWRIHLVRTLGIDDLCIGLSLVRRTKQPARIVLDKRLTNDPPSDLSLCPGHRQPRRSQPWLRTAIGLTSSGRPSTSTSGMPQIM